MKVRMFIKYYDDKKKEISEWDGSTEKKFFKFELYSIVNEIEEERDWGTRLVEEKSSLLSSSEILEIVVGNQGYFSFDTVAWVYNSTQREVFIVNNTINI